jgi:excisionase family DNA binding protein
MIDENFEERQMLTTTDVSQWLKVPIRTICLWAECAELPAIKVGRHWRFRRCDVIKWLETPKIRLRSNHSSASRIQQNGAGAVGYARTPV